MGDAYILRKDSKTSRVSSRLKHIPLLWRRPSVPYSNFNPSDILPQDGHQPYPRRPTTALDSSQVDDPEAAFGAPSGAPLSADGSVSPPNIFDNDDDLRDYETDPTTARGSDEPGSYDLKPPPPSVSHDNIETLALRFFSVDHLDLILRNRTLATPFIRFLIQNKPQHEASLRRYIETKKAITAVNFANAIADRIQTQHGEQPHAAATLDEMFEEKARQDVEDVVEEALPAYVTYRLVSLVTDTLVKEVTGNNTPIMRELIPSLAEVYCVTDPSLPDNPIVYSSEEFSNTTQYGREYVIGRNCRFLQGPKTSNATVGRLIEALAAGHDVCETILNYRRDGTPFMNLLLIAPLYDNKGQVRYFLGCQIDVSALIAGGKGLDSFSQLLLQDRAESRYGVRPERDPNNLLDELGAMLNEDEAKILQNRSRSNSELSEKPVSLKTHGGRRRLGMDDPKEAKELWPSAQLGRSGRLPGVYQNYMLVRPYPSLRITFTSPALRIPGLMQTKLLDRIGGPQPVREGLLDALKEGVGVTAKVTWLFNKSDRQGGAHQEGKQRWIHCTPLLGSDEKIGVWMVVMIENEEVTGRLNRNNIINLPARSGLASPIRPGSSSQHEGGNQPSSIAAPTRSGAGNRQLTTSQLYAEYLKGEHRPATRDSKQTNSSERERREIDEQFQDF